MTRPTIDELEMLTPDELGELLINAVSVISPDFRYIQDLIAVGCPIEARDWLGRTALHMAAWYGKLEVVEFLVSKGAQVNAREVNARNTSDWTALHWAASGEHIEVIKFLISKGADIYIKGFNLRTAWDLLPIGIKKAIPELKPQ